MGEIDEVLGLPYIFWIFTKKNFPKFHPAPFYCVWKRRALVTFLPYFRVLCLSSSITWYDFICILILKYQWYTVKYIGSLCYLVTVFHAGRYLLPLMGRKLESLCLSLILPPRILETFWLRPFFPTSNLTNWFPPFVPEIFQHFLCPNSKNYGL